VENPMQATPITAAELADFRTEAKRLRAQGERMLPRLDPERFERTLAMLATLEEVEKEIMIARMSELYSVPQLEHIADVGDWLMEHPGATDEEIRQVFRRFPPA
jgi:hypothetical protein